MNAQPSPYRPPDLKRRIMDFMRLASTEVSVHDEGSLPELARELSSTSTVYVAHTPKATLSDVAQMAVKIRALGLRASPHIVARRIPSDTALAAALNVLAQGGVEQILIVAGDLDTPVGPFRSSLDVLESPILAHSAISQIGVAGHPEGHHKVESKVLWNALLDKQAYSRRAGRRVHVVTQFGFDPQSVCDWVREMRSRGIELPVHVGMCGPTPLSRLIKFAMQCGVGASLATATRNLGTLGQMARTSTAAGEMLLGLVTAGADTEIAGVVQPHIFAFGGALKTVRWMRALREGVFDLQADGGLCVQV